jgi:hypothetical protein
MVGFLQLVLGAERGFPARNQTVSYRRALAKLVLRQGTLGPKKEARPIGPGKPDALRRNIGKNRQKTMTILPTHELKFPGSSCRQACA